MARLTSNSLRTAALSALIFVAAIIAYAPAISGRFIWNDSDYVTAPPMRPLPALVRIWIQPGATQQYYPLLHSAFWIEHRLWGDHAIGYHLVNLLWHACSAVLLALALRRLSPSDGTRLQHEGTGWVAAFLFALHPVNVESVAWISEQKNTLSLALYLSSALAYLHFDESRRPRAYVAALALFVLSLLSKTVTATLPAALLLVFWWKRGRIEWRRDVAPLAPWLALGALAGLFSSWVERTYVGARGADFNTPSLDRVLIAGRAIWFDLGKLVWPFGLNFIYPQWKMDPLLWWQWLFPVAVLAAAGALWALRRRTRGPLAALLFFVGSLFPALGFVDLYGARYSWVWDHWQYLPDLGPLTLIAAGLAGGWRWLVPRLRWVGSGLLLAVAALLGRLTWSQCRMYHDDQTLYLTTLAQNPGAWMAHNNLGLILSNIPGRLDDAIDHYEEALRLKPDFAEAHDNLGNALAALPGRLREAVAQHEEALRLKPDSAEAHNNLGLALAKMQGRLNDAAAEYEAALRLRPDYAEAHDNLGNAFAQMPGRLSDAFVQYREALRLDPDSAAAHNNLGGAWMQMPNGANEAVSQFEEALRLDPGFADARNNLGSALAGLPGRLADAVAQYEEALRLRPDFAEAHYNLGIALAKMPGRLDGAIAQYEEALRLRAGFVEAHFGLGNAWSNIPGRLGDAAAQYGEALRLRPGYAPAHARLGALLCRMGRVREGMDHLAEAIRLEPDFAEAHFALGAALLEAGRREEAAAEFGRVLQLRPGDRSALRMLDSIRR